MCSQLVALPISNAQNGPPQLIYLWDRNEGPISTDFSKGRENQETLCLIGGAEGDRTPDLCNAIAALSQLSYGPICPGRSVAFSQAPPPWQASVLVVLVRRLDAQIVVPAQIGRAHV